MNVSSGVMGFKVPGQLGSEGGTQPQSGWTCCSFMLPHAKRRKSSSLFSTPGQAAQAMAVPENLPKGYEKMADYSPVLALQHCLPSFPSCTSSKDPVPFQPSFLI